MKGVKLLVVDHDDAFVDYVVTTLKNESATIYWTGSGIDVLARVEYLLPDVIILTADMPDMSVLETLIKIKSQYPLMEVIVSVEQNSIKEAIQGMQRGAMDYIKKPVMPDELIRKIKTAYQKKMRHQDKISRFEKILA